LIDAVVHGGGADDDASTSPAQKKLESESPFGAVRLAFLTGVAMARMLLIIGTATKQSQQENHTFSLGFSSMVIDGHAELIRRHLPSEHEDVVAEVKAGVTNCASPADGRVV
jgi:hypothetical protein